MNIFKEFLEIYGLFKIFPVIWKLSDPSKTNVQPFLHTNYKKNLALGQFFLLARENLQQILYNKFAN
jgi:hypothetical protein